MIKDCGDAWGRVEVGSCEVSEVVICSTLQLFADLSDTFFVVVICRKIVPSNKGILAAY